MQKLDFLNSKAKRELVDSLKHMYGFEGEIPGHLMISGKDKIFLMEDSDILRSSKDRELWIDRAGLKIGSMSLGGIRLNIEGAQLLGPHATQRVLEIIPEHLEAFVKGQDFLLEQEELSQVPSSGLVILKHGRDFIGSGIVKDGKLWNQLSKNRKVKNLNF